jgi:DtxR family Mn-dependent transcriptional regulator
LKENQTGICVGVKDSSAEFLKYLDKNKIALGVSIKVNSIEEFDLSLNVKVTENDLLISHKIAGNIFVKLV